MNATTLLLIWFIVGTILLLGLGFVVIRYLARKGVFKRAAEDAKSTIDQAARDAATKVTDKLGGQ